MKENLDKLTSDLEGTLHYDKVMRTLYATDASIYKQLPLAVAYPKGKDDLKKLVHFALHHKTSLIPRTAGTSLAGQCVGDGIVVDVSQHFTRILEFNNEEMWVRVEPGVVRNELNQFLAEHGLFFGPNTSTANRCMIGGMVGNNSSGTTSVKYGVTRDHVLEIETILSDGSEATFSKSNFELKKNTFKADIYEKLNALLNEPGARDEIIENFPKPSIHRRNTGYALDELIKNENEQDLTKLLCGSEGTLALTTAIKLNLSPLPPPKVALVCAHFNSINESMRAVLIAMEKEPYACELMDKIILDCTKENPEQSANRAFVQGDPQAILVIELRANEQAAIDQQVIDLISNLKANNLGYAHPVVNGEDSNKVWDLRAAGLGLLSNVPGKAKPIACIEDTAVELDDLPDYIDEFESLMKTFDQQAVYYAHAGAGELHLRPLIDLKSESDRIKLRQICEASAQLVKKYKGSLSGEHGDGRVRAEFIPLMVGESNYNRFKRVKQIWDPNGIFNPGKIVDAPPMDEDLRYEVETEEAAIDSFLDFSDNQGLLQAVEKCNGSADCRKITGAMCPTYQATKNEKTTTRARANILREVLTENSKSTLPLADEGLKEVLDLCVSCKACKRECPSNVDMSLMKAEFLYQYNEKNGISLKDKIIANLPELNKRSIPISRLVNFAMNNSLTARFIKQFLGVHSKRNLPPLNSISFEKWLIQTKPLTRNPYKTVYLFIDEFTNFNDLELGQITVSLLFRMGYEVLWVSNAFSGRTYISKGHLQKAKDVAEKNVEVYRDLITPETPLIGIEPSAILTFRDEYPKLLEGKAKKEAQNIATNTFTIEEFIFNQSKERDLKQFFHEDEKKVKAHVHCHQKALSDKSMTAGILSIPKNYSCTIVNGGCCGMAGSFGYEKDKYELSKQMAELHLIPAVNNASSDTIIAASGTSCRHQIKDLASKTALHPVEVLYNALK